MQQDNDDSVPYIDILSPNFYDRLETTISATREYTKEEIISNFICDLFMHHGHAVVGVGQSVYSIIPGLYDLVTNPPSLLQFTMGILESPEAIRHWYHNYKGAHPYDQTRMSFKLFADIAQFWYGGEITKLGLEATKVSKLGNIAKLALTATKENRYAKWASRLAKSQQILLKEALKIPINYYAKLQKSRALKNVVKRIPKVIHEGQQGKHILGHNNFIPGKSILEANAKKLLNGLHSKKYKIIEIINEHQVIVDFAETIGIAYHKDGKIFGPTKYGKIHYGKNGAHIVPSKFIKK
ncbi:MAG: hypothetical protein GY830_07235 [Bacteroidetes bacterium]|nr:hypothetical protein [Bacteroidota bacterium]